MSAQGVTEIVVDPWEDLEQADDMIASTSRGRLTLASGETEATPLKDLVIEIAGTNRGDELARFVAQVAKAQLNNFPDNLFWDFGYYAKSTWVDASQSDDEVAYLRERAKTAIRLMEIYGQQSPIRFRYVHDFLYGFDWARWVRRSLERKVHGPFGRAFLEYSNIRAEEILTLIEVDDEKYPQLKNNKSRNPFPFIREPEQEEALCRMLAASDLIPVKTWDIDAVPVWDVDFEAGRTRCAQSLGILSD